MSSPSLAGILQLVSYSGSGPSCSAGGLSQDRPDAPGLRRRRGGDIQIRARHGLPRALGRALQCGASACCTQDLRNHRTGATRQPGEGLRAGMIAGAGKGRLASGTRTPALRPWAGRSEPDTALDAVVRKAGLDVVRRDRRSALDSVRVEAPRLVTACPPPGRTRRSAFDENHPNSAQELVQGLPKDGSAAGSAIMGLRGSVTNADRCSGEPAWHLPYSCPRMRTLEKRRILGKSATAGDTRRRVNADRVTRTLEFPGMCLRRTRAGTACCQLSQGHGSRP